MIKVKSSDLREKKMIERVMTKIKLPNDYWNGLEKDLKEGMPKRVICGRYGIKPSDLKWLKKALGYRSSE